MAWHPGACARQQAWAPPRRGLRLQQRCPAPSVRPLRRRTCTSVAQLSAIDQDTRRQRRAARFAELSSLATCASLVACGAPNGLSHGALLLVEGAYVALHAFPLLPLLTQPWVRPDAVTRFLSVYTTPAFFLSELMLYALLYIGTPMLRTVWPAAFAAHVAAHVLYAAITLTWPAWALRQNIRRVALDRGGASPLVVAWDALLNVLNALDAGMHCVYSYLLARLLPAPAAMTLLVLGAAVTVWACSTQVQ